MACGVFVQTAPSQELGSLGVILPSRIFWNPKFLLLLPVLG